MKHYLLGTLLLGAMSHSLFTACNNEEIEYVNVPQWVSNPDSLGEYEFHGKNYTIQTAVCKRMDGSLNFVFSPKKDDTSLSTYFTLILQSELATGDTCFFADYYHENDYLFAYEDPAYSYSFQHDFLDGWVVVKQFDQNPDSLMVAMNALLADSTSFKINISNLMQIAEVTE